MDQIYVNNSSNRLVYAKEPAGKEYWDRHWSEKIRSIYRSPPRNSFFTGITKKYLPLESTILEGGCGMGDKVLALSNAGFNAIGIDFAESTIKEIKNLDSSLDVRVGDVRNLPISDGEIDGYWSLGVIEHFYDGYGEIIDEMYRVLAPGGYAFVTFPTISGYRRNLIESHYYDTWNEKLKDKFYQFALSEDEVINDLLERGFILKERRYMDNLKGLKSHQVLGGLASALYRAPAPVPAIISRIMDVVLGSRYCHMSLIVMQKSS